MAHSLLFLFFFFLLPLSLLLLLFFLVRPRPVKVPIKGRHVVITGGSSGIGLAIAHQAASEGARVTILARDPAKLEDARRSIESAAAAGSEVAALSVDVRDFDGVRRAIESCGQIDVLICNHGVFIARELDRQSIENLRYMLDVNLAGTFNVIKAALPAMKNRKDDSPAAIALMASQAGQLGVYGYTAYSASKFGLRGLGEALQQEVIADNIHVSVICPPDTETPGLLEEHKTRPEITKVFANFSSGMQAKNVSKKTLDGIKSGKFIVSCNFHGTFLSIATSGIIMDRSSCSMSFDVHLHREISGFGV